mgnify:FL=1
MGWTRGTLTQKFKIDIDFDKLMEYITDKVLEVIAEDKDIDSVELDEYYADIDHLTINGIYTAPCRKYYAPATRLDPPEYDIERPYIKNAEDQILKNISEDIREYLKVGCIDEDEDDTEIENSIEEW